MSPRTTGQPMALPSKGTAFGLRSMPITLSPRATSLRMRRGPMNPVAPSTSTDMVVSFADGAERSTDVRARSAVLRFARAASRDIDAEGGDGGNPPRVPPPKKRGRGEPSEGAPTQEEGTGGTLRGCPHPRRGDGGEPSEGAPTQGDQHALPPVRPHRLAGLGGGLRLLADGGRPLRRHRGRRGREGHPPRARQGRE